MEKGSILPVVKSGTQSNTLHSTLGGKGWFSEDDDSSKNGIFSSEAICKSGI
jgi:hypothetical protein